MLLTKYLNFVGSTRKSWRQVTSHPRKKMKLSQSCQRKKASKKPHEILNLKLEIFLNHPFSVTHTLKREVVLMKSNDELKELIDKTQMKPNIRQKLSEFTFIDIATCLNGGKVDITDSILMNGIDTLSNAIQSVPSQIITTQVCNINDQLIDSLLLVVNGQPDMPDHLSLLLCHVDMVQGKHDDEYDEIHDHNEAANQELISVLPGHYHEDELGHDLDQASLGGVCGGESARLFPVSKDTTDDSQMFNKDSNEQRLD